MKKNMERIKALREGGQVSRCHTCGPILGTYDVAQHTYNMLAMVEVLYDGLDEDKWLLFHHILWHDLPERWMGDSPHPVKQMFPTLNDELKNIENKIYTRLGHNPFPVTAFDDLKLWVTWLDLLEVYMWAHDQVVMGNVLVEDMLTQVEHHFDESTDVPEPIHDIYANYTSTRLPQLPEFLERKPDED